MLFECKTAFLACAAAPEWKAVVHLCLVAGVTEHPGHGAATKPHDLFLGACKFGIQMAVMSSGSPYRSVKLNLPNAREQTAVPEEE